MRLDRRLWRAAYAITHGVPQEIARRLLSLTLIVIGVSVLLPEFQ